MPFVVVQCTNADTPWVEPIPIAWLSEDKKSAHFPPLDRDLSKSAQSQVEVKDNWPIYPVKVKSAVFELYEDAGAKCRRYVGGVSDSDSNLDVVYTLPAKRKLRPVDSFLKLSAESASATQGKGSRYLASALRAPVEESDPDDDGDEDYEPPPVKTAFSNVTRTGAPSSASLGDGSPSTPPVPSLQGTPPGRSRFNNLASEENLSPVRRGAVDAMYLRKMNNMDVKLNDILRLLQRGGQAAEGQAVALPVQFPMNTIEEIQGLDLFLNCDKNRQALLSRLPKFVDTEIGNRVTLIMNELFTSGLGAQLNWKGSGKENATGFRKTGLRSFPFVYAFLVQYVGGPVDVTMPRVKKWLANSPARAKARPSR